MPVKLDEICARVRPAERAGLALAMILGDQFMDAPTTPVKLVLLDEVTAPIPAQDAERHLKRVRAVADRGIAVVMVTHRLPELHLADTVIVLRGGEVAYDQGDGPRRPDSELIDEVLGETSLSSAGVATRGRSKPVTELWSSLKLLDRRQPDADAPGSAITIEELVADDLRGLSLNAKPGEVLGFMGLQQGGLGELPRVLAGSSRWRSGRIAVGGVEVRSGSVRRRSSTRGWWSCPGDRLREGGVPSLTASENVTLPALGEYWHKKARAGALLGAVIDAFDVRPRDAKAIFSSFSGGNQQKLLLGKWLALGPSVLVLDDPTHGVDPVARETVFDAIIDAAALGVSVLFMSTEPEQLVRVCQRVLVIRDGVVQTELSGPDLTETTITKWSYA